MIWCFHHHVSVHLRTQDLLLHLCCSLYQMLHLQTFLLPCQLDALLNVHEISFLFNFHDNLIQKLRSARFSEHLWITLNDLGEIQLNLE